MTAFSKSNSSIPEPPVGLPPSLYGDRDRGDRIASPDCPNFHADYFSAATTYGASTETAVCFTVGGERLVGNLLEPTTPAQLGVVFVHGYSGVRSGPHGLLTALARAFADAGIASLRFDLRGRGDSTGDGQAVTLATMAEDVVAAVAVLRQRSAVRQVILLGICSGGNVAIGSLQQLRDIAGLILLSVYPFSDGDNFGRDLNRSWDHLKSYWRKAWRIDTWRRLWRGELYFRQIGQVLFGHFRHRRPPAAAAAAADSTATSTAPTTMPKRQEGRFQAEPPRRHLDKLCCRVPTLMIYGSADPDAEAAQRYFATFIAEHQLPIVIETVADANHNFSSRTWQQHLAQRSIAFCQSLSLARQNLVSPNLSP